MHSGKPLVLRGHGDGLRVTAEPSTSYELGPVLPGTDDCAQEIFLCNPTDYAIEAGRVQKLRPNMCWTCASQVYSVDFDHAYSEEEQLLQMYDQCLAWGSSWLLPNKEHSMSWPGGGRWWLSGLCFFRSACSVLSFRASSLLLFDLFCAFQRARGGCGGRRGAFCG